MTYKIYSRYVKDKINLQDILDTKNTFNSTPVELSFYNGEPLPSFLKTKVYSFWNDSHLFFLFIAGYELIRTASPDVKLDSLGKTPELWDISDVFEIFIGPDAKRSKKYIEMQVAPDSRWIDLKLDASGNERQADFTWSSGMITKSKIYNDSKIWKSIFQIPFGAFQKIPKVDEIWNCNFYRISGEEDKKVFLSWSPVYEIKFHQPDKFGDLLFIK